MTRFKGIYAHFGLAAGHTGFYWRKRISEPPVRLATDVVAVACDQQPIGYRGLAYRKGACCDYFAKQVEIAGLLAIVVLKCRGRRRTRTLLCYLP